MTGPERCAGAERRDKTKETRAEDRFSAGKGD